MFSTWGDPAQEPAGQQAQANHDQQRHNSAVPCSYATKRQRYRPTAALIGAAILFVVVVVVVIVVAVCPGTSRSSWFRRPCSVSIETRRTRFRLALGLRAEHGASLDQSRIAAHANAEPRAAAKTTSIDCSPAVCRLFDYDYDNDSRGGAETGGPKGSQGVRRPATLRSTAASLTTRGRNVPVPTLPGGSRTGLTSFLILAP